MHKRALIRVILGLMVCVLCSGPVIAGTATPTPTLPPAGDRPPDVPALPQIQTFAVCGPGTECVCDNVVSLSQAYEGQSCTVTSSSGSCTFTSRGNDVGVCCVCRP
jgi:hypothetical protein